MSTELSPIGLADQMIDLAIDRHRFKRAERVEALMDAASLATRMTCDAPPDYFDKPASVLRLMMVLDCLPSLAKSARERRHTIKVAETVNENLGQQLGIALEATKQYASRRHENKANIVGHLSEMAVLGVMWWGIQNHDDRTSNYAWPSLSRHDYGHRDDQGFNTGHDLVLSTGNKQRHQVQVKSVAARHPDGGDKQVAKKYARHITVVGPPDLVESGRKHFATLVLVKALVGGDHETLERADSLLNDRLRDTQARAKRHLAAA